MAIYTAGVSQLEWRETGQLPTARGFLRAATVDNIIYVTGGLSYDFFKTVLSWDPVSESWQQAGNLALGRYLHAAVAIPSSIIESECSIKLV